MRKAGTRRSRIRAWKSTSVAEAKVVAEYCGYIGRTMMRSMPKAIISRTTDCTEGLPTCMPKRTGTFGSSFCSFSAWSRV